MPAVHIDARETELSLRFPEQQPNSQRNRFFPKKSSAHLSNLITKWKRSNILRIDDLDMSKGDEELPNVLHVELDADDSYTMGIIGARVRAKEITSKNADPAVDWEVERPILLKQRQDTLLEYKAIRGTMRNSTIMGSSYTKLPDANRFDGGSAAGCTPLTTLRNYVLAIKTTSGGHVPNIASCSSWVIAAIAGSLEFRDYAKFTGRPSLVDGGTKSGEGVCRIIEEAIGLPSGALEPTDYLYNSVNANGTEVDKQIIGSSFLMAFVEPPARRTIGFGARFVWNGIGADEMAVIMVPQYDGGLIPGEEARGFSILAYKPYNLTSGVCLDNCVDTTSAVYQGQLDSTT